MDRSILEGDPHSVLEGLAICSLAIGAEEGFLYIRDEYSLAVKHVRKAIKDAEEILVPEGMDDVSIYTESGRFMTGPYGQLVTTAIHEKHTHKEYIGLDACAVNLMRPAMYGAYHHITVLGKEDAACDHVYDVVGSLCK